MSKKAIFYLSKFIDDYKNNEDQLKKIKLLKDLYDSLNKFFVFLKNDMNIKKILMEDTLEMLKNNKLVYV